MAYESRAMCFFVRGRVLPPKTGYGAQGNGQMFGRCGTSTYKSARGVYLWCGATCSATNFGVELNSSEKFEHDLNTTPGGSAGSVDRLPGEPAGQLLPDGVGLDSKSSALRRSLVLNYTSFFSSEPIRLEHRRELRAPFGPKRGVGFWAVTG